MAVGVGLGDADVQTSCVLAAGRVISRVGVSPELLTDSVVRLADPECPKEGVVLGDLCLSRP